MPTLFLSRFTRQFGLTALVILVLTGCISTGAAPTASIKTVIPPTALPATATPAATAVTAVSFNLTQTIISPDGVLTVMYPEGWTAEPRGTSIGLSTSPGLTLQIGQRTFREDELAMLVDYASRADVAAVLKLDANFTLEQLGAATESDATNTTTETIQVNGKPAIGQTGLIQFDDISSDVYSITFEVEGVLVTVTTYAAPQQLARIKDLTQSIAAALKIDTSLVKPLGATNGNPEGAGEANTTLESVTPEG